MFQLIFDFKGRMDFGSRGHASSSLLKMLLLVEIIWDIFKLTFVVLSLVKGVVSQLRPLLSKKQLLVSVVAGVKLKDLQVFAPTVFSISTMFLVLVLSFMVWECLIQC